jgi:uncharacterized membrane protein
MHVPELYSKILTFLISYGLTRVYSISNHKLFTVYKYFELASYILTNLRSKFGDKQYQVIID